MEERVIRETRLPLDILSRGKVKDMYILPYGKKLLIVATDRISAFDVVVGAIPGKGKILTKMSEFWFEFFSDINSHFLSQWGLLPKVLCAKDIEENDLFGRSMVVMKADEVIPIECIVQGYLAGSGWQEYKETGQVCGITLPLGLKEGGKLPEPIFTPATKAEAGKHDENISFDKMQEILANWFQNVMPGSWDAETLSYALRDDALFVYKKAAAYAQKRGIIIADTKLKFGWLDESLLLIDELLTPDSSRFWPADEWKPGRPQKSFDKQYLRDWLVNEAKWDKKPPAPELPEQVILATKEKYEEALRRLVS